MKEINFNNTTRVNGNTLRLVNETSAAILWEGETPGGGKFWEVWKVRIRKEDKILPSGKVLRAGEFVTPCNEDFGVYAWGCYSLSRALVKFNSLGDASAKMAA